MMPQMLDEEKEQEKRQEALYWKLRGFLEGNLMMEIPFDADTKLADAVSEIIEHNTLHK